MSVKFPTVTRGLIFLTALLLVPAILFSSTRNPIPLPGLGDAPRTAAVNQPAVHSLAGAPLSFTENQGQFDDQTLFKADVPGAEMWLTAGSVYYHFSRPSSNMQQSGFVVTPAELERFEHLVITSSLIGANAEPKAAGIDRLEHTSNYFLGNDPAQWRTDVPNYRGVRLENVYPGIDLTYYGNGGYIEYDFIIAPGADPNVIRMQYDGVESIAVNDAGELVVETAWGQVIEKPPVIYQTAGDLRRDIRGEYSVIDHKTFGFRLTDKVDASLPLVIDPVLTYSSYLGGSDHDWPWDIAVDDDGDVYVVGFTTADDFPVIDPIQHDWYRSWDVFVCKLDPVKNGLIFSTYLGGINEDPALTLAVDDDENIYLAGWTKSWDFPVLNAYDAHYDGGIDADAFVAKIGSAGNTLLFSTFLGGGAGREEIHGIKIGADGLVYLAGRGEAEDYPLVNPLQTHAGDWDAVVTVMESDGSALVYSTYFGGTGYDAAFNLDLADNGDVCITGYTTSSDFPTVNALQESRVNGRDAFVSRLDLAGGSTVFSTYLGGGNDDEGWDIEVGADGTIYVTGTTSSTGFPTHNALQPLNLGAKSAFVTALTGDGLGFVYSTFLGGSDIDAAHGLVVDQDGNAFIRGVTYSSDFPTVDPLQSFAGEADLFVAQINPQGSALVFSTFLGGSGYEGTTQEWYASGMIDLDAAGQIWVTGRTISTDFPAIGAQNSPIGGWDVFVSAVAPGCGDVDADNWCFAEDNCPLAANADQADGDSDGVGDVCDNCPEVYNPGQEDDDFDGWGDVCDIDFDNDGFTDAEDNCPAKWNPSQADFDVDGVGDPCDNCPGVYNPGQEDGDGDGIGDACYVCDCSTHCDMDGNGWLNPVDVVIMVNYIYRGHDSRTIYPLCPAPNGDWNCDGTVNPLDIQYFIPYLYKGYGLPPCDPCVCTPYPDNCP